MNRLLRSQPFLALIGLVIIIVFVVVYMGKTTDINVVENIYKPWNNGTVKGQGAWTEHVQGLPKIVNVFNAEIESASLQSFAANVACVPLKISANIECPICVYDRKIDIWVSAQLIDTGKFEATEMGFVERVLNENDQMEVLDLGCNIGVYTIIASKLGHRVVAVDANKKNLMMLSRALKLGNLMPKATLVWNAISDKVQHITLFDKEGNVGGTYVAQNDKKGAVDDLHKCVAITLDHLIPFFSNKPLFMKMDIEGSEWDALKMGRLFFQRVDIRYVFMEWDFHRHIPERGNNIISFFTTRDFTPFSLTHLKYELNYKTNGSWPNNIVWIKH